MTNWTEWFRYQLKASGDGFTWAFSQLDPAYHHELPPDARYMGTWTPARHVWHVTEYERCLSLPSMRQWLGAPLPPEDAWPDNDETWAAVTDRSPEALIAAFHAVRDEQIKLLDQLKSVDWTEQRDSLWGLKPLTMVVTKTYQHTFEHGDTLLRMGLWWEEIVEIENARKAQETNEEAS